MPDPNSPSRRSQRAELFDAADVSTPDVQKELKPSAEFQSQQRQHEIESSFITGKDALLAIPRGAVAAGTEFLNLGLSTGPATSILEHFNEGKAPQIPDGLIFGESDTSGGAMFSALAQFLIPYAAIGKGVKAAGAAKHLKWIDPASATTFRGRIGAEAAKGAVVDFAFFDDEENIANAFKGTPLENDVTDFLAVDDDDGTIARRIKGAIIGAGAGVLADSVLSGLSHARKTIKSKRAGVTPTDAGEAVQESIQEALSEAPKASEALAEVEKFKTQSRIDFGDAIGADYDAVEGFVKGGDNAEVIRDLFTQAGEGLEQGRELGELFPGFTGDPKKMTAAERYAMVLEYSDANLNQWENKDTAVYYRVLEDLHREALNVELNAGRITLAEGQKAAEEIKTRVLKMRPEEAALWEQAQIKDGMDVADQVRELAIKGLHIRDLANHKVDALKRMQESMPSVDSMTLEELDKYASAMESTVGMMASNRAVGQATGQALTLRRAKSAPIDAKTQLRIADEVNIKGGTVEERMAQRGGDDAALRKRMKAMMAAIDARGIEALSEVAEATANKGWGSKATNILDDVFFNFVLSGPMTHAVNLISNTAYMFYRPFPQILGGVATGNRTAIESGILEYSSLLEQWREVLTYTKQSDGTKTWLSEQGKAARKAAGQGQGVLLGDAGKLEVGGKSAPNKILDYTLRAPSKLLQLSDELAKQIAGRARAKAQIRMRATRLGRASGWSNEQIAYKIQSDMDRAFKEGKAIEEADIYAQAAKQVDEQAGWDINSLSAEEAVQRQKYVQERASELLDGDTTELLGFVDNAADRAQDVTFTRSLQDQDGLVSKVGRGAQSFRNTVPGLQWILPFVQTPSNILTATLENSPVDAAKGLVELVMNKANIVPINDARGYRSKFMKQLTSGDPVEKADAIGRLTFSVGAGATAYSLAQNWSDPEATFGLVGSGPRDFKEQHNWQQAGVQFNSIFYTNDDGTRTYIPFSRVEPFGTFFGIVADMATYGHFVDPNEREDSDGMLGLMANFFMSTSVNLTSKTYLKGLADALEVGMSGEPDRLEKWANRTVSAFTVPNALTQTQRAFDADLKQERGMLDTMMSRSGWGAEKLERKRNALGEVRKRLPSAGADSLGRWMSIWNPFTVSETSKDPVDREMARMHTSFSAPSPRRQVRGVRLDLLDDRFKTEEGFTAYDRWQDLTRTVGKNNHLRARLRKLVQTKSYQRLSEESSDGIASEKASEIRRIISSHRKRAFRQLRKEIPAINEFVREARKNRDSGPANQFPDFLEINK